MRKLTAILGLATMLGWPALSHTAQAQAASGGTQTTSDTTKTAAETKAEKRAAKKAAKEAAANASGAAATTAPQTTDTTKTAAETRAEKRAAKKAAKEAAANASGAATTPKAPKTTKAPAVTAASPAEIADAKAKGLVWLNTESKVYHKGGQFYGNTKHGQFMTEADAMKAGGHLAKPSATEKK